MGRKEDITPGGFPGLGTGTMIESLQLIPCHPGLIEDTKNIVQGIIFEVPEELGENLIWTRRTFCPTTPNGSLELTQSEV